MFVAIVALGLAALATAQDSGFTQSYCSSQNTGSGDAYVWPYQSNGNCTNHCSSLGTWAFAVIEYTDCWCSNYVPSSTTSISDCQVDCPGYPYEKCGNKDAGLYIYIEMSGQPSGTAGGSQTSSTSVSSATPIPSSTDTPSSSDAITPSSSKASSTLRTIVTSSATAPSTSVQVITESGAVVTRTVIYQPTEAAQQTSSGSASSNTGAIVGGVVGGVVAIAAVVGGILFFLWRRRKQQRAEQEHQAGITRNTSTMSKSGLLGGRSAAIDSHYPPPIATNHSAAGSRHDNESISPISGSQRRYSQPMMIDSRLNPETVLMYHPTFANSRESLGSIDDSRDYGRQLNVRNPDPH